MAAMDVTIIKTADLGNGWSGELWSDGVAVLKHSDPFRRIDLDRASVDRLRAILDEAEQTAIERLELAVMAHWELHGTEVELPRTEGKTLADRINDCAEEIEVGL